MNVRALSMSQTMRYTLLYQSLPRALFSPFPLFECCKREHAGEIDTITYSALFEGTYVHILSTGINDYAETA